MVLLLFPHTYRPHTYLVPCPAHSFVYYFSLSRRSAPASHSIQTHEWRRSTMLHIAMKCQWKSLPLYLTTPARKLSKMSHSARYVPFLLIIGYANFLDCWYSRQMHRIPIRYDQGPPSVATSRRPAPLRWTAGLFPPVHTIRWLSQSVPRHYCPSCRRCCRD